LLKAIVNFKKCQPAILFDRRSCVGLSDLSTKQKQPDDVVNWQAVEDRLPKLTVLAKAYVALPVASVDF